jgi:hypothetical protein
MGTSTDPQHASLILDLAFPSVFDIQAHSLPKISQKDILEVHREI